MGFAVVVDSTFDMSQAEYRDLGITMVPLNILIDGSEFKDQVQITSEEFFERMAASEALPKTAQPSPYDFAQVYEQLAEQGAEGVISLHIAAPLSGTVESARIAAKQVDVDVRVIDTLNVAASSSLLAQRVCALRDADATLDQAEAALQHEVAKPTFLVACDTLENLLKGGRLSAEQVKTASMLNIKPIFTLDDTGVLVAFGKGKGMHGVLKQYAQAVADATKEQGLQRVRFCHCGNGAAVDELKQLLAAKGIEYEDAGTCPCGATVATHLGVGAVGIGFCPAA